LRTLSYYAGFKINLTARVPPGEQDLIADDCPESTFAPKSSDFKAVGVKSDGGRIVPVCPH